MLNIFHVNAGNDFPMLPAFTLARLQNLFQHLLREGGPINDAFFEFPFGLSWEKLESAGVGKERRELCENISKHHAHQCWMAPGTMQ